MASPVDLRLEVSFYPGGNDGNGSWQLVALGWVLLSRHQTEQAAQKAADALEYALGEAVGRQPVPGIYSEHQHARNMGEI